MTASRPTCRTCLHWHEGAPQLATATRTNRAQRDIGICTLLSPTVVVGAAAQFVSLWPETAADRRCSNWDGDEEIEPSSPDGPDDGERAGGESNVLPLRVAA